MLTFETKTGLGVHRARFCGKTTKSKRPRLDTINDLSLAVYNSTTTADFESRHGAGSVEAIERANILKERANNRKKKAHKEFVRIFDLETTQIIENTPVGSNVSCPECSEEIHRGSFRFHRRSSCKAKDKRLLLSNYIIKDFM